MPICHQNKLIFIHIPKTAGTSITRKFFPRQSNFIKHYNFLYYKNIVKEKIDEYNIFSVIRDPYERIASYFNFHISSPHKHVLNELQKHKFSNLKEMFVIYINKMLFENIISPRGNPYHVNKTQSSFLKNESNLIDSRIQIINYENINSMIKGLDIVNKSNLDLNKKQLYNDESVNIVKNYFIEDFNNFHYNIDINL